MRHEYPPISSCPYCDCQPTLEKDLMRRLYYLKCGDDCPNKLHTVHKSAVKAYEAWEDVVEREIYKDD